MFYKSIQRKVMKWKKSHTTLNVEYPIPRAIQVGEFPTFCWGTLEALLDTYICLGTLQQNSIKTDLLCSDKLVSESTCNVSIVSACCLPGGSVGRGALPWQSDRYARRIFRVLNSDSGIFRVFWKILCRNEILVFLGSAHFPYRVKMRSFQNVFNKIGIFRVLREQFGYF